jgi:hypothetical protein
MKGTIHTSDGDVTDLTFTDPFDNEEFPKAELGVSRQEYLIDLAFNCVLCLDVEATVALYIALQKVLNKV